jgi:hypothetical protein
MKRLARYILIVLLVAGYCRAHAAGVSPFAEVLVWHASEETSSTWSSLVTSGPPSTFAASDIHFNWSPGFRIGLAHEPQEEGFWDTRLYWTYFRTASSATVGNGTVLPEFFSGFLSGDSVFFNSGAVDWSLSFNNIDLEAGHEFALGESLSLRPSLGLKVAVIDQRINARWADQTFSLLATENIQHDFHGLGPSFGVGGRWEAPKFKNLSLVGSLSGALLWGVWNVTDSYQRITPLASPGSYGAFTTSMNNSALGTPMLRYFLGMAWTEIGGTGISARAGYELQWWANQQRLPTFQQLPMHGDLTLQGLTCGIFVSF